MPRLATLCCYACSAYTTVPFLAPSRRAAPRRCSPAAAPAPPHAPAPRGRPAGRPPAGEENTHAELFSVGPLEYEFPGSVSIQWLAPGMIAECQRACANGNATHMAATNTRQCKPKTRLPLGLLVRVQRALQLLQLLLQLGQLCSNVDRGGCAQTAHVFQCATALSAPLVQRGELQKGTLLFTRSWALLDDAALCCNSTCGTKSGMAARLPQPALQGAPRC